VPAYSPFGASGQVYSGNTITVLENPILKEIAAKRGKSTAHVSVNCSNHSNTIKCG
jgi:diketogulonate reductase-like aldo/keto reductase